MQEQLARFGSQFGPKEQPIDSEPVLGEVDRLSDSLERHGMVRTQGAKYVRFDEIQERERDGLRRCGPDQRSKAPLSRRSGIGPSQRPGTKRRGRQPQVPGGFAQGICRLIAVVSVRGWPPDGHGQILPSSNRIVFSPVGRIARQDGCGFVKRPGHIFLLATLDKAGHATDFQYKDHFISATEFEWQSQNRTGQASADGQDIQQHVARGIAVHLFVRSQKKRAGGGAAPFVYCENVWRGEKPITVQWRLPEAVPARLRGDLGVPDVPRQGA